MDLHIHYHPDKETAEQLCRIERMLGRVLKNQGAIMANLDQILQDVTDESTQIDGLSALIAGLQQQVKDALANSGISATDQAKIDAIFAGAESNKAKIATALGANTPPADPAAPTG